MVLKIISPFSPWPECSMAFSFGRTRSSNALALAICPAVIISSSAKALFCKRFINWLVCIFFLTSSLMAVFFLAAMLNYRKRLRGAALLLLLCWNGCYRGMQPMRYQALSTCRVFGGYIAPLGRRRACGRRAPLAVDVPAKGVE